REGSKRTRQPPRIGLTYVPSKKALAAIGRTFCLSYGPFARMGRDRAPPAGLLRRLRDDQPPPLQAYRPPGGAWIAIRMYSSITSGSTGRWRSIRFGTARVVVRSRSIWVRSNSGVVPLFAAATCTSLRAKWGRPASRPRRPPEILGLLSVVEVQ